MIDILPRSDDEGVLWKATLDLAEMLAGLPWTLVGAQMVMLHGFEAAEVPGRTTSDVDLLFDVRALVGATEEATRHLQSAGFSSTGRSPDGVAHRFVEGAVVVDVLAPEGLGPRTRHRTIDGARTVQVPGGSQALERTEMVDVRLESRLGPAPAPLAPRGDPPQGTGGRRGSRRGVQAPGRPRLPPRARPRSRSLVPTLRPSERRWLVARRELLERDHPAWRMSRRADDGYLALRILSAVR